MSDTDDSKAPAAAALGGPEASPETSEAKEHALDRKESSDDEADEAEAGSPAEPTTDAAADAPASETPPPAAAAAATAASGAGSSAGAAADDDEPEDAEDKLAVYRTASTAGRGYVVCYGWMTKQVSARSRWAGSWRRASRQGRAQSQLPLRCVLAPLRHDHPAAVRSPPPRLAPLPSPPLPTRVPARCLCRLFRHCRAGRGRLLATQELEAPLFCALQGATCAAYAAPAAARARVPAASSRAKRAGMPAMLRHPGARAGP